MPSTSMTAPVPPQSTLREDLPMLAIGLRLCGMLLISVMFASVKLLSARNVNLVETIFYRQAIGLLIVTTWIAFTGHLTSIRTKRIWTHASRAAIGLVAMIFNFGSYVLLPLTEATTIGFTMPIFSVILSVVLLREATGVHRWAAVILGFVGVLVMVRPDAGQFHPIGVAVALSAALLTAIVSILLRELGRTEGAAVTVFWFSLLSIPPLSIAMVFYARPHDPSTWLLLALTGISGGIAQICMAGALRWAAIAVVLPMDYSTILWSTAFGWFVWGEWPLPTTVAGSVLIIASGGYIAWREHVRHRRTTLMHEVVGQQSRA